MFALQQLILSQYLGALSMLRECIEGCPAEHWDAPIAKYPFWQVAYHTLCCTDTYLSPSEAEFRTSRFHPGGMADLEDEYPSRRFEQREVMEYLMACRDKAMEVVGHETPEQLAAPARFPRRTFSRAELHVYNIRHIQHHTGQLSVSLRKAGVDTVWVGAGWKE